MIGWHFFYFLICISIEKKDIEQINSVKNEFILFTIFI